MIFTAYLDESGTHAGAPISAMGGFIGDARQWRKFEKRDGKLFKRFRVDVFHAVDVRRGHKDFKGWTGCALNLPLATPPVANLRENGVARTA
jgi:hypothetical protein